MFENTPKIEFLSQMQTKRGQYIEKQGLQNGYLGFFKFCFFDPKNFKKITFFRKTITKIQNVQNFPKTGLLVVELAVFNQCAKFQLDTIIFDPQKGCFVFPMCPMMTSYI